MGSLLVRAGVIVVTVALARLGAWLLVAAVTSSVVVLGLDRWREARDRLPRRLGALAVISADDEHPVHAVPLLVLHSMTGATGSLERAQDLLRIETSFSRWAEGSERVASAEAALDAAPWLRPEREPRTWWSLGAWSFVALVAALSVAFSESLWSVALFVVSFTGTVVALTDLRLDRQWMPQLLATLAYSARSGPRPLSELTAQARGCPPATIERAQRLVRSWDLEARTRRDAETLLELERRDASGGSRARMRAVAEHGICALAGAATWVVPL
jgi:hypothetical protein